MEIPGGADRPAPGVGYRERSVGRQGYGTVGRSGLPRDDPETAPGGDPGEQRRRLRIGRRRNLYGPFFLLFQPYGTLGREGQRCTQFHKCKKR